MTATSRDRVVRVSCKAVTVGVARKQRFGELRGGEVSLTRGWGMTSTFLPWVTEG